jgi:hypothetical protein
MYAYTVLILLFCKDYIIFCKVKGVGVIYHISF